MPAQHAPTTTRYTTLAALAAALDLSVGEAREEIAVGNVKTTHDGERDCYEIPAHYRPSWGVLSRWCDERDTDPRAAGG